MAQIRIEPANVESMGQQMVAKAAEVEDLIRRAQVLVNDLQADFTGQRAARAFQEWQAMQRPLISAVQSLSTAGQFLRKVASDFHSVDSGF